ncbi:unnamed protein product [Symbiodinium necroappetens]|uniref:C2 domain-containing protein n=1 Tax=Symbiodinium necroappetens TaxID=1628268 RepID=A0A812URD9_9DINO|nr:unnamed protein product [Symbiodinium necroappetens]
MGANCVSHGKPCGQPGEAYRSPRTPKDEDDVSRLTMWRHDVEALKEEALKRQQRRDQEAAARQARIEAAEKVADEAQRPRQVNGGGTLPLQTAQTNKASHEKPQENPHSSKQEGDRRDAEIAKAPKQSEVTKVHSAASGSPVLPLGAVTSRAQSPAVEVNEVKDVDEVLSKAQDPSQVRYLLEVKIVSAVKLPETGDRPFVVGLARCNNPVKFRTKSSSSREKAVWNQASKLQIGRGDFLTFRVQDADLDDTAFFARATLDFDRMVPSGFEDEIPLEDSSGNQVPGGGIKVRVRVQGAFSATGQEA